MIVSDGIIDKEAFKKEERKICFLLKQQTIRHYNDCKNKLETKCTEGFGNNEWNLAVTTKYLIEHSGDRYETLYPELTQWAYVFLNDKEQPYSEVKDSNLLLNYLKRTAIVNLCKKPSEEGHTENSDIETYVGENKQELKRQLENIEPTLVICSGTFELARKIYDADVVKEEGTLDCGSRYFVTKGGMLFVEIMHISVWCIGRYVKYAMCKELKKSLIRKGLL